MDKLVCRMIAALALTISSSLLTLQSINAAVPDEVQAIFDDTCAGCHTGGAPSGLLSLDDADISEASLVDVVARCSNNNEKLVEPGEPEASILYIKLANANPNCGVRMPIGAPALDAGDLAIIYDWIVSIGPAAQFGLFAMESGAVTVQETDANVTLLVNRTLGSQGQVTVDFTVETVGLDTATSPTDYIAQTGTLTFEEGETTQEIIVELADDDVFEGSEVFSVTLSNALGGAVIGAVMQSKVSITDNEFDNQPGTFFFNQVSYSGSEADATVDITIIRSFGAGGQVSIDLTSADGTAAAGTDYQAVNQTVVFEEGIRNQMVSLTILDDAVEESTETLTLTLSNPANGALLGNPRTVTLTLSDDDGAADPNPEPEPEPEPEPDPVPVPVEEVEFEAAGSLSLIPSLLLLLLIGIRRRL